MKSYGTILKRDLLLAYRHRTQIIQPLLFFIMVVSLFPLAINPDPKLLKTIGPGIIWVAALLATLLSLEHLFRSDYEDGSLELLLLSPYSLTGLITAKIAAHWLITGLPLVIISPLLGILLHLPGPAIFILMISLLLGTPVLSLIGAIGAALTTGLRQGGILLAMVVLPLYIPILIFGTGATLDAMLGVRIAGELAILGAVIILAMTLGPLATASALRIAVN